MGNDNSHHKQTQTYTTISLQWTKYTQICHRHTSPKTLISMSRLAGFSIFWEMLCSISMKILFLSDLGLRIGKLKPDTFEKNYLLFKVKNLSNCWLLLLILFLWEVSRHLITGPSSPSSVINNAAAHQYFPTIVESDTFKILCISLETEISSEKLHQSASIIWLQHILIFVV